MRQAFRPLDRKEYQHDQQSPASAPPGSMMSGSPAPNMLQPPVGMPPPGFIPRMSAQFSGDTKSESSYELWRQEAVSLLATPGFSQWQVTHAIRKSLHGLAAEVLLHVDLSATPQQIITKLDHIFGNVLPVECILEQFWSSQQREGELVRDWACRLESMVSSIRRRDLSIFSTG